MPNLNYFHGAILALWTPLSISAGDHLVNGEKLSDGPSAPWLGDQHGCWVTIGCSLLIPSTQGAPSRGSGRFSCVLYVSDPRGRSRKGISTSALSLAMVTPVLDLGGCEKLTDVPKASFVAAETMDAFPKATLLSDCGAGGGGTE